MAVEAGKASQIFPDTPQFHEMQGTALEQLGQYDDALNALNSAIALDSTRVGLFLTKGFIYHRLKQWDKGAEAYERALVIEPTAPMVLNNYAYMLSEQNHRLEDALSMIDLALKGEPENASFLDTKGWILHNLNRDKEALIYLKSAIKLDDKTAELYYHLGHVYKALHEPEKSRKAWNRAAKLEPDNAEYARLAD